MGVWEQKANTRGPRGYDAAGVAEDIQALTRLVQEDAGPNAFATVLNAAFGRNLTVWRPPSTDGITNRISLQAAVDAAKAAQNDLLMSHIGRFPIDGTVTTPSPGDMRILGLGRGVTEAYQVTKPMPTFHVPESSKNMVFEDFTGSGDGPSFTMGVATFQNYNVIRVDRGAHGFTARRLGFRNHYMGIMFRNLPNDSLLGVTTPPVRTERVTIDDILSDGVWCALHGGPFDSPYINNIRGRYVQPSGHPDTVGHAPHLIYISSPSPADGVRTDAYYTRGGSITNISAWDGPDYVGNAFSFKYMRGTQVDNLVARNCRGVVETMGVEDCTFGTVTSTEDKFPGTGSDATRASFSMNTSKRNTIGKLSVSFAAIDHGRSLRFESGSTDNTVESLTVVERGTLDRGTGNPNGDIGFTVHHQGDRNTVRNPDIKNLGAKKWCAFNVSGTGSKGQIINPKIDGSGYDAHIRVDNAHKDAIVDYDPLYLTLDRSITSTRLAIGGEARAIVRDRSVGQKLPPGFFDEFERGVLVNGLATTDDGKTWGYRDSTAAGSPTGWQARVSGEVKYVAGQPRAVAIADGGSANGVLRTTIGTAPTGNSAGLAARVTDWNNYISLGFHYGNGDGRLALWKRVAGAHTAIVQSAPLALTTDSVIELVLNGTSISARHNGVEVIAPQTIADFAAVTTHGLFHNSAETALTWKRLEFVAA